MKPILMITQIIYKKNSRVPMLIDVIISLNKIKEWQWHKKNKRE